MEVDTAAVDVSVTPQRDQRQQQPGGPSAPSLEGTKQPLLSQLRGGEEGLVVWARLAGGGGSAASSCMRCRRRARSKSWEVEAWVQDSGGCVVRARLGLSNDSKVRRWWPSIKMIMSADNK